MNSADQAFLDHGLQGQNDKLMDVMELIHCLMVMYEHLGEDHPEIIQSVPLCIDLVLNWLLNVYDR